MGENVTLDMIYKELKDIKKDLSVLEHAVIPTEKLSKEEFKEHLKDLEDALKGPRAEYKSV